ncbi:MAG: glycoside hydrolase 100 family protein [Verrucomicrobiota bacterium]
MDTSIQAAKRAALDVLLHNACGPYHGLPRTAAWGYPEPYTRDLLISALGILASGNAVLLLSLRRVLTELARSQSPRGMIPSLVHDPEDRGASDTTPLFLLVLGMFRRFTGESDLLQEAAAKALGWMDFQTIDDRELVGQQPTSDWRDEQWVLGHGLFVNALVHGYRKLFGMHERALALQSDANRSDGKGFVTAGQPTYALWFYKVLRDPRCDVLGHGVAILTGLADRARATEMLEWIEARCAGLRASGELALDLPPCCFPYVQPTDADWHPRYATYNLPGHYHNGGVWPFVCGFYIAALVAAGLQRVAQAKLRALTELVHIARRSPPVPAGGFGFNEWFRAQDGRPAGEDWQSWSAAMYLYAASCVETGDARFF